MKLKSWVKEKQIQTQSLTFFRYPRIKLGETKFFFQLDMDQFGVTTSCISFSLSTHFSCQDPSGTDVSSKTFARPPLKHLDVPSVLRRAQRCLMVNVAQRKISDYHCTIYESIWCTFGSYLLQTDSWRSVSHVTHPTSAP